MLLIIETINKIYNLNQSCWNYLYNYKFYPINLGYVLFQWQLYN